jgi:hypothetical protein
MRIKAVLRDNEILGLEAGSSKRIVAAALKNLDRVVSMGSLLKIMGLPANGRSKMLDVLMGLDVHIWLAVDRDQHVICISKRESPPEADFSGYKWQ